MYIHSVNHIVEYHELTQKLEEVKVTLPDISGHQ